MCRTHTPYHSTHLQAPEFRDFTLDSQAHSPRGLEHSDRAVSHLPPFLLPIGSPPQESSVAYTSCQKGGLDCAPTAPGGSCSKEWPTPQTLLSSVLKGSFPSSKQHQTQQMILRTEGGIIQNALDYTDLLVPAALSASSLDILSNPFSVGVGTGTFLGWLASRHFLLASH